MIRAAQVRAARKRYKEVARWLLFWMSRAVGALRPGSTDPGAWRCQLDGPDYRTVAPNDLSGISDIRYSYSAESGRIRKRGAGRKKKDWPRPSPLRPAAPRSGQWWPASRSSS